MRTTIYTAEPEVDIVEDTDTLARAAQLDGFSYLLGDTTYLDDAADFSDTSGGLNVQVVHARKQYNSTVRLLFTLLILS